MFEWLDDWTIVKNNIYDGNVWMIDRLNDWTIMKIKFIDWKWLIDWSIDRLNDWTIERL